MKLAMLIPRAAFVVALGERLRSFPAVAILGPRQCGKGALSARCLADPARLQDALPRPERVAGR